MLFATIASAIYFIMVLTGLGLAGVKTLKRVKVFDTLPAWQILLLAYGFIPAFISLAGYCKLQIFIPFAQTLCALTALYALSRIYRQRRLVIGFVRQTFQTYWAIALALLVLVAITIFLMSQWCYFEGGINNLDQFRGLGFIAGFSSNDLKPAHPLDFSIPISYGYYFYMYPALIYRAIDGQAWPSGLLCVAALFAIFWFYLVFIKFSALFMPKLFAGWKIFAILAVSFYGLDFLLQIKYSPDWWNLAQITQMAAYWHWLYHYLFAAALGFASLVCLFEAFTNRRGSSALASIIFLVMTPLYSTLTGLFFASIFLCFFFLMCAFDHSRVIFWRTFNLNLQYVAVFMCAALVLIAPQLFTFVGHEKYLSFHFHPVFWFSRQSVFAAHLEQWSVFLLTLVLELGPLHCAALFMVPALVYKLSRNKNGSASLLAAFASVTFVSITFVTSQTFDWYWRTGNFGLIILSVLPILWALSRLSQIDYRIERYAMIIVLVFLIPGGLSFAYETQQRFINCFPAGFAALALNKNIPLSQVVGFSGNAQSQNYVIPKDHLWWHTSSTLSEERFAMKNEQEAALSLAMQAGRAAYGATNPMWKLLHVYRADDDFLKENFNWHLAKDICQRTWYGESVPERRYIEVFNLAKTPQFRSIICKN